MKKLFLIVAFAVITFSIYAQQTKLLTAEKHNEYGLVYTLPLTSFKVDIVAVKENKIAGPYSKYSKIFTKDANVISKNEVSWYIESVYITPFGTPDSENRYLMQLKPGAFTSICVGDDGMLVAINKEVNIPVSETLTVTQLEGDPLDGKEYLEFVNEDFIAAQSSYKQAQLLAEEIMEIRDAKISLTRGTAETMPTDGRQLEIMLEQLERQEKALMNAFTGSSWKERVVRSFTFTPEKEGKTAICKLNPTSGVVSTTENGDPVYITVSNVVEAEIPLDSKGEAKKLPKDAVMYCIPGSADISVSLKGNTLSQATFNISQFGMLFGLNPSIFTDKKEPSYAIFNPATGALEDLGTLKQ